MARAVKGPADLRRDLIKSESADVEVPELELVLTHGTLGGRVTTVEGLLSEASSTRWNSGTRVEQWSPGGTVERGACSQRYYRCVRGSN